MNATIYYLTNWCGYSIEDAEEMEPDIEIQETSLLEMAESFITDADIPEPWNQYIDVEKFARDMKLSGEFFEFTHEGKTYVVTVR